MNEYINSNKDDRYKYIKMWLIGVAILTVFCLLVRWIIYDTDYEDIFPVTNFKKVTSAYPPPLTNFM